MYNLNDIYDTTDNVNDTRTLKYQESVFMVKIPTIMTVSTAELEMYGLRNDIIQGRTVGDNATSLTQSMITIPKMLQVVDNGMPVHIVYEQDIKKIHTIIEEYLSMWKSGYNDTGVTSINVMNNKDTELQRIDKLAAGIFEHNTDLLTEDIKKSMNLGFYSELGDSDVWAKVNNNDKLAINKVEPVFNRVAMFEEQDDSEDIDLDTLLENYQNM